MAESYQNQGQSKCIVSPTPIGCTEFIDVSLKTLPFLLGYMYMNADILQETVLWSIYDGKFLRKQWYILFPYIRKTDIKVLHAHLNSYSDIIKDIVSAQFSELTNLQLSFNQIHNIEPLTKLNAIKLRNLHLTDNPISNPSAFRKVIFPELKQLYLQRNLINTTHDLSKMDCSLSVLVLQSFLDIQTQSQDLSQIMKLKSAEFDELFCFGEKRIAQLRTLNMMKGKWPKVKRFWNKGIATH